MLWLVRDLENKAGENTGVYKYTWWYDHVLDFEFFDVQNLRIRDQPLSLVDKELFFFIFLWALIQKSSKSMESTLFSSMGIEWGTWFPWSSV